ncbi:MAG: serine/threonine-protein kinase, partial [Myxococcota bacterium]
MSEPSPSPVAHAGPDHLAETLDGPPGEARSGPIALGPERRLGRYTVLDVLGRGGMGVVYAAYDSQLDRRVALKVIRSPDSRRAPRHRQRLLREAQAMARLAHPNVIGVHDVGTLEDEVFLAMEFVAGSTLGEWARDAPRSWRDIRDAYLGAGRGLAAAHAAGLVHRDFKPDNVLIDDSRRARVTDFGLARADDSQLAAARDPSASDPELALDRDDGVTDSISGGSPLALRMTKVGTRIGTPAYMAPEQHAGEEADALSDQFSFCVALYEAFFDRAPFRGGTPESLAAHVLAGRVRSPPSGSPVPGPIRRAVMRGLSVRPEHRFATMGALLDALAYDPARRRRRD